MSFETDAPMFSTPPPRKHLTWDPTINLGHVITFTMSLIAVIGAYYSLEKRISKQEDMAPFVAASREEKDRIVQTSMTSLATDMKDVKSSVEKLSRAVEVQNAVNDARKK